MRKIFHLEINKKIKLKLKNMNLLANAMEWVKKQDKLPAITEGFFNCLICRNDKNIRQARFNCKTQRFQNMEFEDIHDVVTHWMPLPELPSA